MRGRCCPVFKESGGSVSLSQCCSCETVPECPPVLCRAEVPRSGPAGPLETWSLPSLCLRGSTSRLPGPRGRRPPRASPGLACSRLRAWPLLSPLRGLTVEGGGRFLRGGRAVAPRAGHFPFPEPCLLGAAGPSGRMASWLWAGGTASGRQVAASQSVPSAAQPASPGTCRPHSPPSLEAG